LRLVGVAAAVLIAVVVATTAVVHSGPPSKDDLIQQAGLVGKRDLLVGVIGDQPGIAVQDPATGQYSGFDIDIAYLVASDLGFDRDAVRFLSMDSKDRARMQARQGNQFATVDLAVAAFSITPHRAALPGVHFSAPYLRTAQSVLTRRDHPSVQSFNDLADEKVCTITTSTSVALRQANQSNVVGKNKISDCVDELLAHHVDAVTTDAVILAGFVHAHPDELRLHALGIDIDEQWGINTGSNTALRTLVNLSLYHSRYDPADDRWEKAFDRNLRPEQPDSLPQEVANGEQPEVPKVRVREWPWQRDEALAVRPGTHR
ncbi:MAG: transporter substrate-binding domain-containing protein, partial [Actinocatenispora sp.]